MNSGEGNHCQEGRACIYIEGISYGEQRVAAGQDIDRHKDKGGGVNVRGGYLYTFHTV